MIILSTDAAFLLGDAVATVMVGAGIVLETEKPYTRRKLVAVGLVIVGVIAETLCSVGLFVHDEGVSRYQRAKIIALEERITPRTLEQWQFSIIRGLRGKVRAISFMSSPDSESAMFSAQLQEAFSEAGIPINPVPSPVGEIWAGTRVCLPSGETEKVSAVWNALVAIGLHPAHWSFEDVPVRVPMDIPLVIVGERPPFWPNGKPTGFRFRAHPSLQPKRP